MTACESRQSPGGLKNSEMVQCYPNKNVSFEQVHYVFFTLLLIPSSVHASDPTGYYYLMMLGVFMFAWPLILPLFFMKNTKNKLIPYIAHLFITFGAIGVVGIPFSALTYLPLLRIESVNGLPFVLVNQILSFIVAVLVLKKYSRDIVLYFKENKSE